MPVHVRVCMCVCARVWRVEYGVTSWLLMFGVLYTYLAESARVLGTQCNKVLFMLLSEATSCGHQDVLIPSKLNTHHPIYCHVKCKVTPSMKAGVYHVYVLLKWEGNLQEPHASVQQVT